MWQYPIRSIFVEKSVSECPVTLRVLQQKPADVPVQFVDNAQVVIAQFNREERHAQSRGKQALLLADFHVDPIKDCPGTPQYLCCGYEILNFASGCILDCSYCILQSYFSNPLLIVQANSDALLSAAENRIRAEPDRFFRLGTGEFTDSLALDPLTGYAKLLVEFISQLPNATLELKSKAAHVDDLLSLDHKGRTVCAWSVNAEDMIEQEEFRVASLAQRLNAAGQCASAGYKVAFHFDPIFHYPGWQEGYRRTIQRIFESVPPESIAWISLGCFRYLPGLEEVIRERFPTSKYTYDEFILGGDHKMRYPQPLRIHIYRRMVDWIRAAGGDQTLIYFCMENPRVWQSVFQSCPRDNAELKRWLDERCGN